jgi:hypothetical protein
LNIQPTSDKASEYVWFGKDCLRLQSTGTKAIQDGMFTVICKHTPEKAILIVVGGGNFLCHPRSGTLKQIPYFDNQMNEYSLTGINGGGWNEAGGEISNRTVYPLQDDDNGTYVINADDLTAEWTSSENYGNIWWIGEDGTTLSWHGNPNRHFPIDTIYNIPGLTEVENVIGEPPNSKQFFTCFKNNVYQDGEILATVLYEKHLVAGACYQDSTLLVAVVDGTVGYKLKLLKQQTDGDGWDQVGSTFPTARLKTPAFFSSDGKTMTFDGAEYNISPTVFTLKTASAYKYSGTQTEGTDRRTFGKQGTITGLWLENGISETLAYKSDISTTTTGTGASTATKTVPLVSAGSATYVTITGPETGRDGCLYFGFETDGPYCEAVWSGSVDKYGKYCPPLAQVCTPGSPGYSATITLSPKSLSDTYTVASNYISPSPVVVRGPDNAAVGQYSASGGIGTFTWSISCGTINADTGYVSSTSGCAGCPTSATVRITATDPCGNSSYIDSPIPGTGSWVTLADMCSANPGSVVGTPTGVWQYNGNKRWMYTSKQFGQEMPSATFTDPDLTCKNYMIGWHVNEVTSHYWTAHANNTPAGCSGDDANNISYVNFLTGFISGFCAVSSPTGCQSSSLYIYQEPVFSGRCPVGRNEYYNIGIEWSTRVTVFCRGMLTAEEFIC